MPRITLFTSESVSAGHPDKVADQISDAVLDRALTLDPRALVACETFIGPGLVVVGGEIHSAVFDLATFNAQVPEIVRETLDDIGYGDPRAGFDLNGAQILVRLAAQSA